MEKNLKNVLEALKESLEMSLKDAERNLNNPDTTKEYWDGRMDGIRIGLNMIHLATHLHSPSSK